MYESPIQIFTERIVKDLAKQQDDFVFQEILKTGVSVDKEELIRALKYDRDQYEKGYADGKADALADLVRCKCCAMSRPLKRKDSFEAIFSSEDFVWCTKCRAVKEDDDFCKYGERKDNG